MLLSIILLVLFNREACNADNYISNSELINFQTNQALLLRSLFDIYDAKVMPIYTLNNQTQINDIVLPDSFHLDVELIAFKLVRVTETEQKIDVLIECQMSWIDYRLQWDPNLFGNIPALYVQRSKIFVPELTPTNAFYNSDIRENYQQSAGITYTGLVGFYATKSLSVTCNFDMSHFPFDYQTCLIRLESPSLNTSDYSIGILMNPIVLEEMNGMGNGEWTIRNITVYPLGRWLPNNPLASARYAVIQIQMKRTPIFYLLIFMFPSFIINSTSFMGIFIRGADSMERITVGLTNLLSMTFLLGVLSQTMPRTDKFPFMGFFFIINLLLIVIAVIIAIVLKDDFLFLKEVRHCHRWLLKIRRFHLVHLIFQLVSLFVFILFCTTS